MRGRAGSVRRFAGLGVIALLLAGCGFLDDMATPDEPVDYARPTAAVPTEPPAPVARTVATASIRDGRTVGGGPWNAGISVQVHPPATGIPRELGSSFAADCGLIPDQSRFVAVDVLFTNRGVASAALAADVDVVRAAQVGGLTGAFGVFVASSDPAVRYCQGGATTPAADRFAVPGDSGQQRTVTAYVVTDVRTTPDAATPEQAFGDLVVQLRNLRNTAYAPPDLVAPGEWTVQGFAVGGGCPEHADSICTPLG